MRPPCGVASLILCISHTSIFQPSNDPNNEPRNVPNNTMKTSITRLALLVLASAALTLTSCRTVRGFGQDVEHVGGHIERASR